MVGHSYYPGVSIKEFICFSELAMISLDFVQYLSNQELELNQWDEVSLFKSCFSCGEIVPKPIY
jgi:hypothetical protein